MFGTAILIARQTSLRCTSTDRKSTRLNSSHLVISYAVFCLKKKNLEILAPFALTVIAVWLAVLVARYVAHLGSMLLTGESVRVDLPGVRVRAHDARHPAANF